MIKGIGRAFRKVSKKGRYVNSYVIYIPSQIAKSKQFPLKHKERVLIEIIPEEQCITITPLRKYIERKDVKT